MNTKYKGKLLLVDDNEKNMDLLIEILSDTYDISIAMDGLIALERVLLDLPDLILLDIMMPGMDGYEVCKTIKQHPRTKFIPIIFLTAKTDEQSIVKGFESGGADYVTKPFNEHELLARVKHQIDLKKSKEELIIAKNKAEKSEKAKTAFLATMSHEIRTPMNAVLGMASLLKSSYLDQIQKDYVDSLINSGETLMSIINDILDLTQIESGTIIIENFSFQLEQCLENVYHLLASKADEKGIELIEYIDPEVPDFINSDKKRLQQILFNLIDNAIKFTDTGEIYTRIKVIDKKEDQYKIEFSIKDTGIGIPPEKMDYLFKPFTQLDNSLTRKYCGTGLGLALSDKLAKLMGGEFWAKSEKGNGSTFFFTINTKISEDQLHTKKTSQELLEKRILIVDNNATLANTISLICKNWGMHTYIAKSGKEALEVIEKTFKEEEKRFDIAVLDMEMPEMNGLTLAQNIQQHPDSYKLPLILLNSINKPNEYKSQKESLFSIILNKPFRTSLFYKSLTKHFTPKRTEQNQKFNSLNTFDSNMSNRYPLKILVADDIPTNQKVMMYFLKQLGYQADLAFNGIEVLKALNEMSYDIIFMDIMMPEMNGVEATQKIRKNYSDDNNPWIIALTADAYPEKKEEYLSSGMNDYISKPMKMEYLTKSILKYIESR